MAVTITRPTDKPQTQSAFVIEKAITSDTGTVDSGFIVAGFLNTGGADATVNVTGGDTITIPPGTAKTYADPLGRPFVQEISINASSTTVIATVVY